MLAPAHAQSTWYVDAAAAGPGDGSRAAPFPTIQQGVDAAAPGDVVSAAPGAYVESVVCGRGITVESQAGPLATTLRAAGPGSAFHAADFDGAARPSPRSSRTASGSGSSTAREAGTSRTCSSSTRCSGARPTASCTCSRACRASATRRTATRARSRSTPRTARTTRTSGTRSRAPPARRRSPRRAPCSPASRSRSRSRGGAPGGPALLVLGASAAFAPVLGGTLVPQPGIVLAVGALDGAGVLQVPPNVWPLGVPAGLTFYAQTWIADAGAPAGFAATHGLSATAP